MHIHVYDNILSVLPLRKKRDIYLSVVKYDSTDMHVRQNTYVMST
jgi:hypothetical protein